jgi:hypothetical protein
VKLSSVQSQQLHKVNIKKIIIAPKDASNNLSVANPDQSATASLQEVQ